MIETITPSGLTGFLCEVMIFHYLPEVIMYILRQISHLTRTPLSLQLNLLLEKKSLKFFGSDTTPSYASRPGFSESSRECFQSSPAQGYI